MQATRTLLRAAGQSVVQNSATNSIPAPNYFHPASKAPSPNVHMLIASAIGLSFAVTYKVRAVTLSLPQLQRRWCYIRSNVLHPCTCG